MRGRLLGIVAACASVALLAACGGSTEEASTGLPDDATVSYAFQDASVPPQYHRSVTLTVTHSPSIKNRMVVTNLSRNSIAPPHRRGTRSGGAETEFLRETRFLEPFSRPPHPYINSTLTAPDPAACCPPRSS